MVKQPILYLILHLFFFLTSKIRHLYEKKKKKKKQKRQTIKKNVKINFQCKLSLKQVKII